MSRVLSWKTTRFLCIISSICASVALRHFRPWSTRDRCAQQQEAVFLVITRPLDNRCIETSLITSALAEHVVQCTSIHPKRTPLSGIEIVLKEIKVDLREMFGTPSQPSPKSRQKFYDPLMLAEWFVVELVGFSDVYLSVLLARFQRPPLKEKYFSLAVFAAMV